MRIFGNSPAKNEVFSGPVPTFLAKIPDANILILTTFDTSDGIAHALNTGAKGAVMKNCEFGELVAAIHAVAAGQRYISADIERVLADNPPSAPLSPRQTEILESITRGFSNPDIAKQLDISLDMVKEHVAALLQKIGAANRAEAVAIAHRKHLIRK